MLPALQKMRSHSRAVRAPLHGERVAEHRPSALGLLFGGLVLDDVPVLGEDPVFDPEDVRSDPVHRHPEPRKTAVDDDEVAVRHDDAGLVIQSRREAPNEVEVAFATRRDVGPMLNVVRRRVAFSRD